jgi:hypothetical protein
MRRALEAASVRTRCVLAPTTDARVPSRKSFIISELELAACLQNLTPEGGGKHMDPISQFTVLAVATLIAAAAALAMAGIFLRGALRLMQPAAARPFAVIGARRSGAIRSELVQGTRAGARPIALHR